MSLTGQLGTIDSRLGNLQLGSSSVDPFALSVSSSVTFVGTATLLDAGAHVASNTLTFGQTLSVFNSLITVGSVLTITQLATVSKVYSRPASDTLVFYTLAECDKKTLVGNTLTFTNDAVADKTTGVSNTLVFSQAVTNAYNPHYDSAQRTELSFTGVVTVVAVRPTPATNTLTFVQSVNVTHVKSFSASNTFVLTNNVLNVKTNISSSSLTITQDVTLLIIRNRSLTSTLNLVQQATRQAIYSKSATNNLAFASNLFKSDGSGGLISVPSAYVVKVSPICTLQIPGLGITLPQPLLGDSEGTLGTINLKRTMDGGTFTYVRRSSSRELKYKFEISRAKAFEMRNFVQNSLSKKITLTNWKGEVWYGNLMNNPFDLTAESYAGPCGETYQIDVDFQGVRVN